MQFLVSKRVGRMIDRLQGNHANNISSSFISPKVHEGLKILKHYMKAQFIRQFWNKDIVHIVYQETQGDKKKIN